MRTIVRGILEIHVWFTGRLKRLAIRLVRWTGKSDVPVHPKHLITYSTDGHWYLKFLSKDDDVLDVGCGNGMHTFHASEAARHVVGIDYSERNLRHAEELKRIRGVSNVDFVAGDLSKPLPFDDARFDKILFLDVLEHLNERVTALRGIRRVLKPEGILLLSVPNAETSWRKTLRWAGAFSFSDADHKIEYTRKSLIVELKTGGFEPVNWYPSVYDTPWIGFIDVVGGISLSAYQRLQKRRWRRAAKMPLESIGFWVTCRPT